jgi:hypothetical protein
MATDRNTLRLTILAQDPSVRLNGRRLTVSQVTIPFDTLGEGPAGHRVRVVDFDASTNRLYLPYTYKYDEETGEVIDPWAPPKEEASAVAWARYEKRTLADPRFHAQNVYAIAMRTLARFEYALGRRVPWGCDAHQLQIAPHAFCDANAFYSEADRALLFGYFPRDNGTNVFTCLSHDVVAHETTHALLDGLRDSFTEPSSPDQAAFHEGFADVVALLSMFSLKEIVKTAISGARRKKGPRGSFDLVPASMLERKKLQEGILFGLAKEVGREIDPMHRDALRRSIRIPPSRKWLDHPDYQEAHSRGEIFVAAFLGAFLDIWVRRIEELGTFGRGMRNLDMVVDEGSKAAEQLLTIAIRALDYCPPTDIDFSDYLTAMLTADAEVAPDDSRYGYRKIIRAAFESYGIDPPKGSEEDGTLTPFDGARLVYSRTHYDSMLRDREEVFRFVWENRATLGVDERGYTDVRSVRPSTRIGPDGFVLHETICEYVQIVELFAAEMKSVLHFERPEGMPTTQSFTVYAGGTLIFDEYGRVKYHVAHPLTDLVRQQARMEYLWKTGFFDSTLNSRDRFAALHLQRAMGA